MPLIIITGLPTSGKSTRAKQLHRYLEERIQAEVAAKYRLHLISDQTQSISRTVYDLSPENLPAHTRSANASEKDARAALYGAVKRVLSTRDIVILDGLNYIKGWRYQLHTEAKNARTPSVVLQIGCTRERSKDVNEQRLAQKAQVITAKEGKNPTETSEPGSDEVEDQEEPYAPGNWENLVFRYEEPNPMTRWDSPLFTLIWEDDDAQTREVFDRIWDSIAGEGRKIVRPNMATVQRDRDPGGSYLYILDRETQDIVKKILEQQEDEGGGVVRVLKGDGSEQELELELPGKKVGLPQLQRYRRAFVALNRGGIGLDALGNMAVGQLRESFVGYLNDAFEKDG
ncbi:chromatin associated protein KTI12, partial [Thozetella sp. PMI_491]